MWEDFLLFRDSNGVIVEQKNKGDNGVMGSLVCRLSFVKRLFDERVLGIFVYSLTTLFAPGVVQSTGPVCVSSSCLHMYCVLNIC